MLAGSDISDEAFPHHLTLGTDLPAGSPVILCCSSSIWTGVAEHPGWGTQKRWLQPLSHKASSSSVTSQTQIFVLLWKSPLYHILPSSNPALQPDPAEAPRAVSAMGGLITPCPSHCLDCPGHSTTTEDGVPALTKNAAHCLDRCITWETTSEHICQPSFHWGGTGAGTAASCSAGTGGCGWRNLAGCLSGSASSRQIASEVCWKLLSTFQVSADSHWQFC